MGLRPPPPPSGPSIMFRDVMAVMTLHVPRIKLVTETHNNQKINMFYYFLMDCIGCRNIFRNLQKRNYAILAHHIDIKPLMKKKRSIVDNFCFYFF